MTAKETFEAIAKQLHMDLTVWHGSYTTGPTNEAWKYFQLGWDIALQTQQLTKKETSNAT